MDWSQILVIMLAVLFAIFLAISIVIAVLILKLTRQIKSITASTERTMHALEGSVKAFNKTALPMMAAKGIINQFKKRPKTKERSQVNEQE